MMNRREIVPSPQRILMTKIGIDGRKAIPVFYNGYKMRSRLEGKHAVCFDHMGVKYQYETRGGFKLPSGPYLPDFYLPEFKTYVEIKPEELDPIWLGSPRIYFAGDMNAGFHAQLEQQINRPKSTFVYAGPVDTRDPATPVFEYRQEVIKRDLDEIRHSDVVFALLNNRDRFGTLTEIGFAKALGKLVVVGIVGTKCGLTYDGEVVPWKIEPTDYLDETHSLDPLWFGIGCADHILRHPTIDGVLSLFWNWLDRKYPRPAAFQSVAELAAEYKDGTGAAIIFGDPLEFELYQFGPPNGLQARLDDAIEARRFARGARFEHGETPKPPFKRLPPPDWSERDDDL